jgi:3'(2'), 5'-bisphosphate nucleotidase
MLAIGSSLKFCRVAEAAADLYPRLGPTSEWDTAAGQAVLEAAGGCVLRLDGSALAYNEREELLNPHFVAMGAFHRPWIDTLRQIGVS